MPNSFPIAGLALLALASCQTSYPDLATFEERHAESLEPYVELRRQKAELWRFGQEPLTYEFEGEGTVHVRRWELQGWPGQEYVRARINYENTTDKPVFEAIVWMEILDREGNVTGSSAVRVFNPMGYPIWPGDSVTTDVRAPTYGAHKDRDGWQWALACESFIEKQPGLKPRLVIPQDQSNPRRDWSPIPRSTPRTIQDFPFNQGFTERPGTYLRSW